MGIFIRFFWGKTLDEIHLRLSKYFGTSSKFWLNLQNELDLREARTKLAAELDRIPAHVRSA